MISPRRLVALMCISQVLVQIGAYAWPALLPTFMPLWGLDNSEAGWITGIFYAAYTLAVPFLVTLTDRIDPKRIYLFGVLTTALGHLAFVYLVDGFWSALAARALAGVGWAGSYMTGLKLLADRVQGDLMSRAVSGHAAGVGVAGAVSFLFADRIAALWGWPAAFLAAGICAGTAFVTILALAPWQTKRARPAQQAPLLDFGPVIRNRAAMAYALAYCVHTWEMNALRGWAVAFLAFVAAASAPQDVWISPAAITTVMALLGTAASVLGNEAALKWGRARMVRTTMLLSMCCGLVIGFAGVASYSIAAVLVTVYGILIWLDSSSLTAGTAMHADPARRGATLAVHSMLGYGGGFVGPLALGWTLDALGGMSQHAWGAAFAAAALAVLAGRIAFGRLVLERAGRRG
ncbi:MAG: MFS transporter [Burkholderiales bacterium]|nr:MFS transporter [Burkholderiales bacterium]